METLGQTTGLPQIGRPGGVHGELYLDDEGEPHFQCHTPAGTSFEEARAALRKWIALLQRQITDEESCPYYKPRNVLRRAND